MKNIQLEDGHTRIANIVLEKLFIAPLSGSELKICLFVIRQTWGWKKKEDRISITQIEEKCDLSRKVACESLRKLVTKKLLLKSKGSINTLQFNKQYEEWLVTKRLLGSYKKVTTLVTKKLLEVVTKSKPTKETLKETITKEISTNVLRGSRDPQIDEISSYFLKVFQLPKEDGSIKWNRIYWNNLIKQSKTGINGVKWLIDLASQDEFLRPNITSAKSLSNKQVLIVSRRRGKINTNKIAVNPAIKEGV